jgi:hypothetical protein
MKTKLSEKLMLRSAEAWDLTYCKQTIGWPGLWTLIWRNDAWHGKLSSSLKQKKQPTKIQIKKCLEKELLERFQSVLKCDAKRIAFLYIESKDTKLPIGVKQAFEYAESSLYDLDNKVGSEFWNSEPPRLFTLNTHGWILAEIAEIRCFVSHLKKVVGVK